jgi:cell shape-determining protein MreC
MNMSSFKAHKRRPNIFFIIGLSIVGALVVWGIVRAVIGGIKEHVPLASATTVYNTLLPKKVLVHKITELQTTLESYDAQLTTAKLLASENDALKAELGRTGHIDGVLGYVTTLPNRSIYDTFVIDAGMKEGIAIGQVVYGFGTIALGTITDVASDHATVQLFSASGRESSGSVGPNNVAVTLTGRGGGEYEVRLPRDLQFTTGEVIAYQSVHSAVLATIERIATDPRDPFQKLIAKAPINLQALKWVIVR